MKLAIIPLALLALAGCSSAPQLQAVKIPVPVECRVQVPSRPAMPTEALTPASTLDAIVQAALAEIELREGFEIELQAALGSCTRPLQPTVP